jgi:outer membrane biosynthesis protein TonB
MSVIEKLKEAVRSVVQERQDLYAEARLNDGRVIATEAEQFSAGASVRVLSEDGEAAPLEAGTYELSDGGEVTVDAESNVVEMMEEDEEKTEAAEHEEEKDEMAAVKAALVDHFQISEEVAEQIVEVVKDAMVPKEVEAEEHEDKEEEMEEEEKEEMSVEMSSHVQDLTHEMAVALEAINKRLEKLEEAPAAQPDRVLPKQEFNAVPKTDSRSSSFDNAYNIINSFK